ncbi:MAG TPA: dTDP-4-dehydrorhamnose 3,5-epimerase family protein [Rhodopila sp.]|jgi:dTDP-4-dehydrorhamnose 3,5-epimerase|nr:dTDP-4-dehydrorhamnose 3,5-epimerase family protein [Rhodopila sp.]
MRVIPTLLPGVVLLQPQAAHDARGSFARLSCLTTLAAAGVAFSPVQTSLSRSSRCGTLRGLHYQVAPAAETKIVHCVAGAMFDVVLDLRPDSPSFRRAFCVELTAANGQGLLVPRGCAHGLLTLTDDAAVLYQIDRDYDPGCARGVRWDDPAFAIPWPSSPVVLSDRDAAWPDFVS